MHSYDMQIWMHQLTNIVYVCLVGAKLLVGFMSGAKGWAGWATTHLEIGENGRVQLTVEALWWPILDFFLPCGPPCRRTVALPMVDLVFY
jgi:hypothetical protein